MAKKLVKKRTEIAEGLDYALVKLATSLLRCKA